MLQLVSDCSTQKRRMVSLCSSLLSLLLSSSLALATFHPDFESFLTQQYGNQVADSLARRDIGAGGSFGGNGHQRGTRAATQAVVLVHGVTNEAGTFADIRDRFRDQGFPPGSIYATTYGYSSKLTLFADDMFRWRLPSWECNFIKQIRMMIQAVAACSRRKVDVIGYSMGSPVARKAIMGGQCVDTGEYLGPPLTALVDTYLSVGGANHGSFLCILPFPGACNGLNGLSCNSRLLSEINSRAHYEGDFVFSIYSPGDDKVGHTSNCGGLTTSIPGQNAEIQQSGNHDQVLHSTWPLQRLLITQHHP